MFVELVTLIQKPNFESIKQGTCTYSNNYICIHKFTICPFVKINIKKLLSNLLKDKHNLDTCIYLPFYYTLCTAQPCSCPQHVAAFLSYSLVSRSSYMAREKSGNPAHSVAVVMDKSDIQYRKLHVVMQQKLKLYTREKSVISA